jgi:hypothetical protein
MTNFISIPPVGIELPHSEERMDRRTDGETLES